MRASTFSHAAAILAVALSVAPACALTLRESANEDTPAKVVSLSTERRKVTNPATRDQLRRRAGTVEAGLDNEESLYFVNASLGTPAQDLRLHLDTGSSDLWVNVADSSHCSASGDPCKVAGTYSANSSSSYSYVGSYFNISYVDGSSASGDYVTDLFKIGDSSLKDFQFGIGYTSTSDQGILGIGYPVNEVQVSRAQMDAYENLPAKLVSSGAIQSKAYSLWLNDVDASKGSILFGGVDTEQYHGTLKTLPVQKNGGQYSEFLITMTALQVGDAVIADDEALAVLLDSGSSLTYLPDAWTTLLFNDVGAQYDPTQNAAYVPCTLRSSSKKVKFTFSGPSISIEMSELVLDITTADGEKLYFSDGTQLCLFGIAPAAATSTRVLGDTFLRSAYVVYDLDNNEISLAQTNFNATKTNVLEITGPGEVPGATLVPNVVSATAGIIQDASATGTVNAQGGDKDNEGVRAIDTSLNFVAMVMVPLAAAWFGTMP